MKRYDPQTIEPKWQKRWEKDKLYQVDIKGAKKPYYNLMMFPYPSGEGLHVGHGYAFSGSDIHGRFKKMQGFDVFEPMGYDAFGIHSENFAIKENLHPAKLIAKTVANIRNQLESLGCMFDWSHQLNTVDPNYYKWTQWIFLQLFKAGLAVRKKASVNFCPSCKTVLADEQVIAGRCERCDSLVEKKELEQWFFKITNYAERLLKNLDIIDWSENVKTAQRNWIGKSEGTLIKFQIPNSKFQISVFTTRPDTIFGATFVVLAPEHPLVKKVTNTSDGGRLSPELVEGRSHDSSEVAKLKDKLGVFTGTYCINPLTKESIPIWVADYVSLEYGTGAIMAVPAHDQRDWDFAQKYNLPIKIVICPNYPAPVCPVLVKAYEDEGYLIESGEFTGLPSQEAKKTISEYLKKHQLGQTTVTYHLREWLISRQRYWGPPIPIIYCGKCGIVPVPEKDLPVLLPYVEDFKPKGTGESPLAEIEEFIRVKCPKCGAAARRETDVSDNFLDSAWYFLRYPSTRSGQVPFDPEITRRWLPVEMYIGGPEHAVLHLMYTRFITMVLHDMGYLDFEEPFKKFRSHGHITKDGAKMSKSRGNVVNPDEYLKAYGADTFRTYLMFMGPYSEGGDWQDKGIGGVSRFLNRAWNLVQNTSDGTDERSEGVRLLDKRGGPKRCRVDSSEVDDKELRVRQKTIKKVTEDIENLRYNTAIAALMEYVNFQYKQEIINKQSLEVLLLLLAPFAPHITEELWQVLGNPPAGGSVHQQVWPKWEEKYIKEEKVAVVVQVNAKVRDQIEVAPETLEEEVKKLALGSPKVQKHLAGQEIKKTVYIPGRLINFVTK